MNENELIRLLDAMRGQSEKFATLLIHCEGDTVTIASSAPGCANTASFSLSENTRMARNAMVAPIIQILLSPYNTHE